MIRRYGTALCSVQDMQSQTLRFSAYFNRRLGTHPRVSHAEIISLFYGTPWITWDFIHNNGGACCIGGLELLCHILIEAVALYFKLSIAIL